MKFVSFLMYLCNKSEAVNIEEFNFTKESDKTLKILKEIQCGLDSNTVNYLLANHNRCRIYLSLDQKLNCVGPLSASIYSTCLLISPS